MAALAAWAKTREEDEKSTLAGSHITTTDVVGSANVLLSRDVVDMHRLLKSKGNIAGEAGVEEGRLTVMRSVQNGYCMQQFSTTVVGSQGASRYSRVGTAAVLAICADKTQCVPSSPTKHYRREILTDSDGHCSKIPLVFFSRADVSLGSWRGLLAVAGTRERAVGGSYDFGRTIVRPFRPV